MERTGIHSESIASVGFQNNVLEVEFVTGAVYQYFDVPEHIFIELMEAGSRGGYLNKNIKAYYRYRKL